jgi:hypothetical protein
MDKIATTQDDSTFDFVNKGMFGELPLLTLVPAGALLLLIYGIYGIRRTHSCLDRLREVKATDSEYDKNNEIQNKLYSHAIIYATTTGFNVGVLLINMIPTGIVRTTSFLMFAALLLWVMGHSLYNIYKIERTGDCADAYDKLTPLKAHLWGYLGGAIGIFIGLALVKGMASFGYTTQIQVTFFIISVQMLAVSSYSVVTYNQCKDYGNEAQKKEMKDFYDFQKWPIIMSGIFLLAIFGASAYGVVQKTKDNSENTD